MRPWILAECNYGHIKESTYDVAVLPFGATEPHNLHLPYSTDTIEADEIGSRICEEAHARGAKVILLPTIPYGTETNQAAFPLSLNLNPSTIQQILTDLLASLVGSGIKKVLILNSHGGNEFKPMLRELYGQTPAALFLCNWFQMVRDVYSEIFAMPEDPAGEMETSPITEFGHLVNMMGTSGIASFPALASNPLL
jgi:creatinine amidohydrolase